MARWMTLLTLSALLGAGLSLAGCKRETPDADLVLTSPHDPQVQQEFERAFSAWHQEKFGQPVTLQWRDIGGTSQIVKYLQQRAGTSEIDLFFGGGDPAHVALARTGDLQPIELPEEVLAQLPESIAGVQQYDPQAGWYGACLSSFGIIYNAQLVRELGLEPPRTWEALSSDALYGRVAGASAKSGSAKAAYELILQTAPDWPTGWGRLLGYWGNCQSFTEGSSDVMALVGNGQALAATAIDYYAIKEARQATPGLLEFVVPDDGGVFTPDPISMLKGAPHPQMAQRFIEFVLSPQGQALWCLPTYGSLESTTQPAEAYPGPTTYALYRQPIRKDVYQIYQGRMLPELAGDVFSREYPFTLDQQLQNARVNFILPPLMQAAAIDNSQLLHRAWKVVIDRGRPANLMAEFSALPENLATTEALLATAQRIADAQDAADDRALEQVYSDWRGFFRTKYERIIAQQ